MRYYAIFMNRSVYPPNSIELVDACGSDATLRLDGRLSQHNMHLEAMRWACRLQHIKQYDAYRLIKCEGLNRPEVKSVGPFTLKYPIGPI